MPASARLAIDGKIRACIGTHFFLSFKVPLSKVRRVPAHHMFLIERSMALVNFNASQKLSNFTQRDIK